jgi:hypothetical protein
METHMQATIGGTQDHSEHGKPVQKFSTGAISAAVWRNESQRDGKTQEFFTVTLERRYNKDGKWLSTKSLRVGDLPKAALVLDEAFKYLVLNTPDETV